MRRALLVVWLSSALVGCGGVFFAVGSDKDKDIRTPLEKAAQAPDVMEVQRLLASGADPNDRGGVFGSPLNAAAFRHDNGEVIRALLTADANPNGRCQPKRARTGGEHVKRYSAAHRTLVQ